jgi:hypothetical protein
LEDLKKKISRGRIMQRQVERERERRVGEKDECTVRLEVLQGPVGA